MERVPFIMKGGVVVRGDLTGDSSMTVSQLTGPVR